MRPWVIIPPLVLALAACTGSPIPPSAGISTDAGGDGAGDDPVCQVLLDQYRQWAGTPYRRGGLGPEGLDCSGLVYLVFLQAFNINLPRTVAGQSRAGKVVHLRYLKPGHLLFFKTGIRSRHVGIYVGHQKFLHASNKKGVTLSSIERPWWADRLWRVVKIK